MQYQVYNFAAAARVDRSLWLAIQTWIKKSCELFVEQWIQLSDTQIGTIPMTIDAKSYLNLQASWDQPSCGIPISFNNEAVTGMLLFKRDHLLALLMDILGESGAVTESRELTSVESSLAVLVFEQIAKCLAEGWPEQESLEFELGEIDLIPKRNRLFAPAQLMAMSGLDIELGGTKVQCQIALKKDETELLLGVEAADAIEQQAAVRVPQETIEQIEIRILALLGKAEVSMHDLLEISTGDVVVLDQPIHQPLTVIANEEAVFNAWPGRVENLQVLKIESVLN